MNVEKVQKRMNNFMKLTRQEARFNLSLKTSSELSVFLMNNESERVNTMACFVESFILMITTTTFVTMTLGCFW